MELRLRRHNGYHPRWQCAACGESFVIDTVIASLYDGEGVAVGEICERCAEAGVEELRARLQRYAQSLHAQAARLERLATEEVRMPPAASDARPQTREVGQSRRQREL